MKLRRKSIMKCIAYFLSEMNFSKESLQDTNLSCEVRFRFRRVDCSLGDIIRILAPRSIWFWPLVFPPALFWLKAGPEEAFGIHNCCWWPCWRSNSARSQFEPESSAICRNVLLRFDDILEDSQYLVVYYFNYVI